MAHSFTKVTVRKVHRFLILKAQNEQTTNYEEIALKFGLPSIGNGLGAALSPILGEIFDWCKKRGQPPLTSIVVRKSGADEGLPGQGFWDLINTDIKFISKDFIKYQKQIATELFQNQVFEYYTI